MAGHYILLVEDDQDHVLLALRALKHRLPDTKVVVKQDGAEALEFLAAQGLQLPQVVLLDLKLPKVSGLDVLARIRANPRTKWLPVVVLTSSLEASDLQECYRLGASSYIQKPNDYTAFTDNIERTVSYWTQINRSPSVNN